MQQRYTITVDVIEDEDHEGLRALDLTVYESLGDAVAAIWATAPGCALRGDPLYRPHVHAVGAEDELMITSSPASNHARSAGQEGGA